MSDQPRISTPLVEGQFQAAKWIKMQALVDASELELLFEESFMLFPLSGMFGLDSLPMKKEAYLTTYASWVDALKEGRAPAEPKELNVVACVQSSDAVWLQEVPGSRYLVKPCEPFVQIQVHQMGFSSIDNAFRPMVMSRESIFWGLQFSFPQVYQKPKTLELLESEDSELFQTIRKWIRNMTVPTPMLLNGKRINIPMRLGRNCFPWINNHPQLKSKGLSVLQNALADQVSPVSYVDQGSHADH